MATQARAAFGAKLKIGDGQTTETFAEVAEVKKLKFGFKLTTKEVTSHSSPNGWTEKIVTLRDGDKVKFKANWLPGHATHNYATGILRDMASGAAPTLRNFQLVIPAASPVTWTLSAYVVKFDGTLDVDSPQEIDVELEITGQPTLA